MASLKRSVCLLAILVGLSNAKAEESAIMEERKDLQCRPGKYGLLKMENRRLQNEYCMMHAARTCCDDKDAEKIMTEVKHIAKKTMISKPCAEAMESAMCSHCDPDIGSGVQDGMCLDYCDSLFDICKDDLIDISSDKQAPFCLKNNLLCTKVSEKVNSGIEFCKLLNFPISKL